MKVKLVKTVVRGTVNKIQLYVDGKESEYGRKITGHSHGEFGNELLTSKTNICLSYGNRVRNFMWDDKLWDPEAPFSEAAKDFITRVGQVRAWIEICKEIDEGASGTMEIEL